MATRPQTLLGSADLGGGDVAGGALRSLVWGALLAIGIWGSMRLYRTWPARAAFAVAIPGSTRLAWQLFGAIARVGPGVL